MFHARFIRNNIILFSILILAFILRIIYLDSKSLWLDEAVNVYMAENNVFSWSNNLPPLYFAFLHFWLAIGKSEIIVRFPSVIMGVLSVFVTYKIGTSLYGKKEALVGAFLMSVSSAEIVYSQNALYYSLFIPLSLLSVYFFLRAEEEPTKLNKILFVIFTALDFYAHYFTVLLLIVFITYKIWRYKKYKENIRELKSFFLLVGVFFLLIAPIAPIFISQTLIKNDPSNADFKYQLHLSPNFIKEVFNTLIIDEYYPDESMLPYIIMVLFLYGVFSSLEYFEKSTAFLMLWLFIPIIFALVLINFISNLQIRYLIFILPALLLVCSHAIVAIPDRFNRLTRGTKINPLKLNPFLIILILVIVVIASYPILIADYTVGNYDWRGAAESIENSADNGSNVILAPGYNIIPFNYYYKPTNRLNILEYSNSEGLANLSYQNNTYLVATSDVYGLGQGEVNRLKNFISSKMEKHATLYGIVIYKKLYSNDTVIKEPNGS